MTTVSAIAAYGACATIATGSACSSRFTRIYSSDSSSAVNACAAVATIACVASITVDPAGPRCCKAATKPARSSGSPIPAVASRKSIHAIFARIHTVSSCDPIKSRASIGTSASITTYSICPGHTSQTTCGST